MHCYAIYYLCLRHRLRVSLLWGFFLGGGRGEGVGFWFCFRNSVGNKHWQELQTIGVEIHGLGIHGGIKKTHKASRSLIIETAEQVSILYWNWQLWFQHYNCTATAGDLQ